ncbi:MAG: hypothetical protein K2Y14_05395 [Burkholderiales bacterium]|nr:hypothetical protein [Burkholderiales bacterium]
MQPYKFLEHTNRQVQSPKTQIMINEHKWVCKHFRMALTEDDHVLVWDTRTPGYKHNFKALLLTDKGWNLAELKNIMDKTGRENILGYCDTLYDLSNHAKVPNISVAHLLQVCLRVDLFREFKLPLLIIDNHELLEMLENTDIEPELEFESIHLPFDDFFLKFRHDLGDVEVLISKSHKEYAIYGMGLLENYLDENSQMVGGTFTKTGNKVIYSHDSDAESESGNKKLERLLAKILFFLSIQKSKDYIEKKSERYLRAVPLLTKSTISPITTIKLFDDVVYKYENKAKEAGGTKAPHLVRGHFRNQPYGTKGNQKIRIIWLEPYFTGDSGTIKSSKTYRLTK